MNRPRLALFVLEALPNAGAVRRFVADHAADIAFVGLSDAERTSAGGFWGQLRRHLGRSGPGFLPYLAVNFALPDAVQILTPRRRGAGVASPSSTEPLASRCRRLGVPVLDVDDVNGPAVAEACRTERPDLLVSFHFDQIFSAATLALAPLGGLNVHPGLLPRHRGPVPTIHALMDDPPAFGVTVHRLVPAIDAGAILAQEAVPLPSTTTATAASMLLHERGRLLLDGVLDEIARSGMPEGRTVEPLPYCPFPSPAMLKTLRARGCRLTDWRDLRAAVALNGPGR